MEYQKVGLYKMKLHNKNKKKYRKLVNGGSGGSANDITHAWNGKYKS